MDMGVRQVIWDRAAFAQIDGAVIAARRDDRACARELLMPNHAVSRSTSELVPKCWWNPSPLMGAHTVPTGS
jgi:hypothetical protein